MPRTYTLLSLNDSIYPMAFMIMKHRSLDTARLLAITAIATVMTTSNEFVAQAADDADLCGFASSARFTESAPRDRFQLQNMSSADWDISKVSLDLSTTTGNLIFDITADGAGVEVFQPFRNENSSAVLQQKPVVLDGDQIITLIFERFIPTNDYVFSIDIDDQLRASELGQIRVSGAEMQGAIMTINIIDQQGMTFEISGAFDESNQVNIHYADC